LREPRWGTTDSISFDAQRAAERDFGVDGDALRRME
jgi:hypothetical protein